MKKYAVEFLKRGLMFSGFGPVIAGIVFLVLEYTVEGFSLSGGEVLIAIISTYLLAFIQAGASIFNQIETWPLSKSLLCHMGSIYLAYVLCYLVNSWIPFDAVVILIFTVIFVIAYLVIWLSVYFAVKATGNKLNQSLDEKSEER